MDLFQAASGAIQAVNPFVPGCTIQISTGSTTDAAGHRTPTYTTIGVQIQVQPLQYQDLKQMDNLNIAGIRRKVYIKGDYEGLVRVQGKGGDIVTIPTDPEGQTWLVAFVFERWTDWISAAITLQNGS